jgi:hypothetical protein
VDPRVDSGSRRKASGTLIGATLHREPLFEPFDPRVTATFKTSRSTYVKGILDYVRERPFAREDWPVDTSRVQLTHLKDYPLPQNPLLAAKKSRTSKN